MESRDDNSAIGKTKTAILLKDTREPIAIITEIYAQAIPADPEKKITFHGPVTLEDKTIVHLETVIYPIVNTISHSLGLPSRSFDISISNVGASSARDLGLKIAGFSADVPFFLSMLSAGIGTGLRQDVIATGHIASLAGDVAPVLGIPAKMDAAVAVGTISEFLFPDIENDMSAALLIPKDELSAARKFFYHYKGEIRLKAIRDIHDAIRAFFTDDAIAMSALVQGFFDGKADAARDNTPLNRSVAFLLDDNENRFWRTVQDLLFRKETEKAQSIIQSFINYHLARERYPHKFGERLYRLAMSLPLLVRKLDGLFPLLSVDQCIALSHHAKPTDHTDVQILYRLTSPNEFTKHIADESSEAPDIANEEDPEDRMIRKVLFELSEVSLARKIGMPLDDARASYLPGAITIKDAFEFNQAITSFYIHLMRHTQSPEGHVSWDAAASEALNRLEDSFRNRGGYATALTEAKTGIKGGLRFVFDVMTDSEKSVMKAKYTTMILKEAIGSLDWEAKVRCARHMQERYGRHLPESFREIQPEQLAHRLEEALQFLAEGEKDIDHWLRTH